MSRHIGFREQPVSYISASDEDEDRNSTFLSSDDDDEDNSDYYSSDGGGFSRQQREREARAADRLSVRLLALNDDDSVEEDRILQIIAIAGPRERRRRRIRTNRVVAPVVSTTAGLERIDSI